MAPFTELSTLLNQREHYAHVKITPSTLAHWPLQQSALTTQSSPLGPQVFGVDVGVAAPGPGVPVGPPGVEVGTVSPEKVRSLFPQPTSIASRQSATTAEIFVMCVAPLRSQPFRLQILGRWKAESRKWIFVARLFSALVGGMRSLFAREGQDGGDEATERDAARHALLPDLPPQRGNEPWIV